MKVIQRNIVVLGRRGGDYIPVLILRSSSFIEFICIESGTVQSSTILSTVPDMPPSAAARRPQAPRADALFGAKARIRTPHLCEQVLPPPALQPLAMPTELDDDDDVYYSKGRRPREDEEGEESYEKRRQWPGRGG